MKEKDYKLGWFYFYIRWRFPISFVRAALTITNEILQGMNSGLFKYSAYTILFIVDIMTVAFAIVVYINMRKLKPVGYTLNKVLIILECLTYALVSVETSTNINVAIGSTVLFFVLWGLPNLVYFKHRRFLFDGLSTLNDLGNSTAVERKREILFCNNCGYIGLAPIQGGTHKCPQCAMPLTNSHVSRGTWTDLPQQGKTLYIQRWKQTKPETRKTEVHNTQNNHSQSEKTPITQFCRKCGTKLTADTVFCPNCGTKVIQLTKPEKEPQISGAEPAKEPDPVIIDSALLITEDFRKDLPARLRRAFILAEDGDWEKADGYFDRELEENPENAYAYLGKLLCEKQVRNVADLRAIPGIAQDKSFIRANRYADENLKPVLQEITK